MNTTQTAQHTPGELELENIVDPPHCRKLLARGTDGRKHSIGHVYLALGVGVDGSGEANARELVRRWNAFPELLAACETFVDYYDQAGIGPCREDHDDDADNEELGVSVCDPDERFYVRLGREAIAKARRQGA